MDTKAVIFDYGGVISFFQTEEDINDLAALAGVEPSLMRRIYWDNRAIYDQGLVSGTDYFKHILADTGVFVDPPLLERLVERDLQCWIRVNPKTESLIRDVKAAGMKAAVLSNMVKTFLERVRDSLPVFALIDEAVFSCDVGEIKPGEQIYRIMLERLGCAAEEAVFFDDLEANVKAAKDIGIKAFLWESPEEARRILRLPGAAL